MLEEAECRSAETKVVSGCLDLFQQNVFILVQLSEALGSVSFCTIWMSTLCRVGPACPCQQCTAAAFVLRLCPFRLAADCGLQNYCCSSQSWQFWGQFEYMKKCCASTPSLGSILQLMKWCRRKPWIWEGVRNRLSGQLSFSEWGRFFNSADCLKKQPVIPSMIYMRTSLKHFMLKIHLSVQSLKKKSSTCTGTVLESVWTKKGINALFPPMTPIL